MRVYINLLLKKRTQIKPENNDLFRIHQLLLFLSGQASEKLYVTRASLLYYNCLSHNVITSISCGLRTLEEEIHIESEGSRVLREKHMFTLLSFIFQFLEGKYYYSSKRISS